MLRKNLGNAKVAWFIFNHGIPELFDMPLGKKRPPQAPLQSMLEDAMRWHASMLVSIVERETDPCMDTPRKLADLDQAAWRQQRKETTTRTQQEIAHGKRSVKERDSQKSKI